MSRQYEIPSTPRVISPSPDPSDTESAKDGYFGPVTRSAARKRVSTPDPIHEEKDGHDSGSDSSLDRRARTRSRSPVLEPGPRSMNKRRMSGLTPAKKKATKAPVAKSEPLTNGVLLPEPKSEPQPNGYLSPYSSIQKSWREFSRSPSPLGLIPLHRHYRTLVHKHEVPRKLLHVSIGFFTLNFYIKGYQTSAITPWLLSALLPIAATDFLRHRFAIVNKIYIRCLGALMRETEVDGYNGVIWYLLGAFIALRFYPKDIGTVSVLLLSWCDTAASTFGRLYGRYTIRLRRGKSLAGTLAAFIAGVLTSFLFWGYLYPKYGDLAASPADTFMFTNTLRLPRIATDYLGWDHTKTIITGPLALGIMSIWTGLVASASEFIDILGWDDNLTIPVLSSLGLWGFLKIFGC